MQTLLQEYEKLHRQIGRTVYTGFNRFGPGYGHKGVGILTNVAIIDGRIRCFIDSIAVDSKIWELPRSQLYQYKRCEKWDIRLNSGFGVDRYLRYLSITAYGEWESFVVPKIDWRKEGF